MGRPWRVKHRSVGHLVCCMPWGSETVEEKEHLTTCRAWPRQLSGPVSSPASIVAAPGQNDFHLKATFSTQVPFPTTVMATVCNLLCNLRCNLRCNHRSNLWSSTALYAELPHRMRHSVYSIPSDERLTVCGAPSSDGMLPISYAELPHRMECCPSPVCGAPSSDGMLPVCGAPSSDGMLPISSSDGMLPISGRTSVHPVLEKNGPLLLVAAQGNTLGPTAPKLQQRIYLVSSGLPVVVVFEQ